MLATSRRAFIRQTAIASAAVGTLGATSRLLTPPATASAPIGGAVGCIGTNDPASYLQFATFLGRKPTIAQLSFDQSSPAALWGSVSSICQQAGVFMADGAQILWSVPCPGPGQLENIANGIWTTNYTRLFQSILAASPANARAIFARLPWEFNLSHQQNAARDKDGHFNATLFIAAWQVLTKIVRSVSPRFRIIWCPNVTTMQLDPLSCWPGGDYVDVVAQDFYMQTACHRPGDFNRFLNDRRGLLWGAQFAASKGKRYGLSEWGMDSDTFVGDFNAASLWLKGLGTALQHQCWWDRTDVIDCMISNNAHPGLAAAYKAQWA